MLGGDQFLISASELDDETLFDRLFPDELIDCRLPNETTDYGGQEQQLDE